MEEIKIKVSSILRELFVWLVMLLLAFITNIYAIFTYDGQWGELVTQLHIVLLLSIFYYVVLLILRLILKGILLIARRFV